MNNVYIGKRVSYKYDKKEQPPMYIYREVLEKELTIFEYHLYSALSEAMKEFALQLKQESNPKHSDVATVLGNSVHYLKNKGKAILSSLINQLELKRLDETQFKRAQQKVHAYIRMTERKYKDKKMDLDRIERISVWVRESIKNLERDLGLDKIQELETTQHTSVMYQKRTTITLKLDKIA